jgi:hypothetical protein
MNIAMGIVFIVLGISAAIRLVIDIIEIRERRYKNKKNNACSLTPAVP